VQSVVCLLLVEASQHDIAINGFFWGFLAFVESDMNEKFTIVPNDKDMH